MSVAAWWKLLAVALGAVLVACQWTPPRSSALEEARRAVKTVRADPLVTQAASRELAEADEALQRAERAWVETRDEAATNHLAYLAFQRAVLARNVAVQHDVDERVERARLLQRAPAAQGGLLAADGASAAPAADDPPPGSAPPAAQVRPAHAEQPAPAAVPLPGASPSPARPARVQARAARTPVRLASADCPPAAKAAGLRSAAAHKTRRGPAPTRLAQARTDDAPLESPMRLAERRAQALYRAGFGHSLPN